MVVFVFNFQSFYHKISNFIHFTYKNRSALLSVNLHNIIVLSSPHLIIHCITAQVTVHKCKPALKTFKMLLNLL